MEHTVTISWLAGFLDGDGCVALVKQRNEGSVRFTPTLLFSQSDKAVLEAIQREFGGRLYQKGVKGITRKTPYELRFEGDEFMPISERLMSRSILKKEALFLVRRFWKRWRGGVNPKLPVRKRTARIKSREQEAELIRHQLKHSRGQS